MQVLKVIQNNVTISLDFHHDYCAQKNTQLDAMIKNVCYSLCNTYIVLNVPTPPLSTLSTACFLYNTYLS